MKFRISLFACGISVLLVTLIIAISFFILKNDQNIKAPKPELPKKSSWTIMLYMSGDNDLEEYIVKDIEHELAKTGSSKSIQVVALADRGPGYDQSRDDWQSTKLFHIENGMLADSKSAIADWGERNMGDKNTLIDFVTWSKNRYPAEHYALYFWGHGWNWHPGYVMEDDTDKDSLDMDELRQALPSIGFIDLVGYDGCNMASLEVDAMWHGHATAVTSSQEFVDWSGIDYSKIIEALTLYPDMTADQLAIASSRSASDDKTWSAVAVDDRIIPLFVSLNDLSSYMHSNLTNRFRAYKTAFGKAKGFTDAPLDKDLYDLVDNISHATDDISLKAKSNAVMNAVKQSVLDEHHAIEYKRAHGITISTFDGNKEYDSDFKYYSTIGFPNMNSWVDFLNSYKAQYH